MVWKRLAAWLLDHLKDVQQTSWLRSGFCYKYCDKKWVMAGTEKKQGLRAYNIREKEHLRSSFPYQQQEPEGKKQKNILSSSSLRTTPQSMNRYPLTMVYKLIPVPLGLK